MIERRTVSVSLLDIVPLTCVRSDTGKIYKLRQRIQLSL